VSDILFVTSFKEASRLEELGEREMEALLRNAKEVK
jgi:hypothetical protein